MRMLGALDAPPPGASGGEPVAGGRRLPRRNLDIARGRGYGPASRAAPCQSPARARPRPRARTLVLAMPAHAQSPRGAVVVPKGGEVAGKTYGEWLGAWWKLRLDRPPDVSVCREVGDVAVLIGGRNADAGESDACTIPFGQAVYVNGLAAECSTMQPRPLHGGTTAQLKSCARRQYRGAEVTATVDGRRVYATLLRHRLTRRRGEAAACQRLKSKRRSAASPAYGSAPADGAHGRHARRPPEGRPARAAAAADLQAARHAAGSPI